MAEPAELFDADGDGNVRQVEQGGQPGGQLPVQVVSSLHAGYDQVGRLGGKVGRPDRAARSAVRSPADPDDPAALASVIFTAASAPLASAV